MIQGSVSSCTPFLRLLLVLLLALTCWGGAYAGQPDATGFFDQGFGDFSEELTNARVQGKQGLLLMYEMEDCPYCQRMKATVLNRSEVQAYFRQHFLVFPVDIQGDVEVTDFSGRTRTQKDFAVQGQGIRTTPVFAFYDLTGHLIAKYAGAISDPREFIWLGEYVVSGRYQEMPFSAYRHQRQEAASGPAAGQGGHDG
jgi:thioredoxin-related protein